jgi:hypothetical protein
MLRGLLISAAAAALCGAVASAPANMILSTEGAVFAARGGETLRVDSTPFTLETGDIVTVSPGGRATIVGESGPETLTVESGPRTIAEPNTLIATMLSASPAETARVGGTDFSTMRSTVHLSHRLESPRNTALLERPASITIALPAAAADDFLTQSAEASLSATVTLTVFGHDSPLMTRELSWGRGELQALLDSDSEEWNKTVDLGELAQSLPEDQRIVVSVVSPALQRLALQSDPSEPPPEDRAWFTVLGSAERPRFNTDLAEVQRIISATPTLDPAEADLWKARVIASHGLMAQAEEFASEAIASLPDAETEAAGRLREFEQHLVAQIEAPWSPSSE